MAKRWAPMAGNGPTATPLRTNFDVNSSRYHCKCVKTTFRDIVKSPVVPQHFRAQPHSTSVPTLTSICSPDAGWRKGLRCYARHGPNGQGSHEDAKVLGDGNERYEARRCRIPAPRVRTAAQAVAILQIQPWAQNRWKPSCITHISPYCGSSHVLGPVPLPVTDVIDAQLTPSEHPLMLVAIERCKTLLIIGLNYATRNYIMHAQSCTTH